MRAAPVFPVRDLGAAMAFYEQPEPLRATVVDLSLVS